ncbi:MAG: MBL fold metallo-hydrolase, partial [Clostridiales bacterium]
MMKFCSLYSGSNGNSIFISDFGSRILVDAGLSGKLIDNLLFEIDEKPESLNGILVTHEHLDHIIGAGVLSRRYNLPIYANKLTWDGMKKNIGNIDEKNIRFFENNKEFCIGDIIIKAFPISHDANDPVGFRLKV